MARAGATGQPHARGFAGLMGRSGVALAPLGDPWALAQYGLILKPWPSCGYTHRLMTAALELRPRLEDRIGRITAIHASQSDFHKAILPFDRPTNRNEALFSTPACLAQALTAGRLTLADSARRFWQNPDVARLIRMVRMTTEPARNAALNFDPEQPDRLDVTLDDEVLTAACAYPLGTPQNPMSEAQLAAKYAAITGHPAQGFGRLLDWPEAGDVATFFLAHGQ
jgi:2-methylcitrate dehydratase PrpD